MNVRMLIGALPLTIVLSCGQAGQQEHHEEAATGSKATSDSIYNIVMEDHNVAMAKMGKLVKYQELCANASDSITSLLKKNRDPELLVRKIELDSLRILLRGAEKSMNHWMEHFEPDSAGTTEASKLKYYNAEKEKVGPIKDNILSLLSHADSILNK